MTVKDQDAKVLDPSCGSGGFLVKTYHRLLELKGKKQAANQKEHQQIFDQLMGVEINQFPAHLSVINLEMQNIKYKSDHINVLVSDFFNVQNFGFNKQHTLASLNKADEKSSTYRFFDTVVANPPYIRQEQIKQKQQIQQLMSHYGAKIDKTSDIYSYFFVHASNFLKNGGWLGFITSNKWLEVKYGEGLQKFFLDNYQITAIIEFDAGAFEEALVNTAAVILQKEKDASKRDNNPVKFVRVKKGIETKELVDTIRNAIKSKDDRYLRITIVPQKELRSTTKWSLYLRAPQIYYKILQNSKMAKFEEVASINRGITTGVNEFFCLDVKKQKAWEIEKEFLYPLVQSPRDLNGLIIERSNIKSMILNVNERKDKLKGTACLKYIEYGEEQKFNKRPTVKNRNFWYSIGNRKAAPIIFPYLIWKDALFVWNKSNAFCSDVFHEIYPKKKDYSILLLGILNSSLTALLCEISGRSYGGGILKVQTFEAQSLPVLNPSKLNKTEITNIEKAFIALAENHNDKNQKLLDDTIFDALSLSDSERKSIVESLKEARYLRDVRRDKDVLVE